MHRFWRATLSSIDGLVWVFRSEAAFRQEVCALVFAVPASFVIAPDWWMRAVLIGAILLILMVELLNTAFEKLSDHVTPEHSPAIKVVKDLGSAAVMLSIGVAGLLWAAALIGWLSR